MPPNPPHDLNSKQRTARRRFAADVIMIDRATSPSAWRDARYPRLLRDRQAERMLEGQDLVGGGHNLRAAQAALLRVLEQPAVGARCR